MAEKNASDDQDEHVVIVGAGGSIGRRVALRMAAAGKHVIGIGRSPDSLMALADEMAAAGRGFLPLAADMSADAAIAQIAGALDRPVAMIVHSPGLPVAGGIRQAPTDALVEACNIKVGGLVRLVRAVEKRLRRSSRLVAIGGHYGFEPTAYAATAGVANAALANLVRQLNWAYGPDGITAHLVAPGPVDSDRLRSVATARAQSAGTTLEAELCVMAAESAIGGFTTVDQIAWAVAALLAPEADAMAGSTLFLDSGRRRGLP